MAGSDRFGAGSGKTAGSTMFDDILRRLERLEWQTVRHVTGGGQRDQSGTLHIEGVPDTKKGDMIYNDGTGLVKLAAPTMDFLTAGRDPDDPLDAGIIFNHETMLPEYRQTTTSCSD